MKRLLPATAAAALMLSLLGSVPAMASAHRGPAASPANAAATRQATTPDTSPAKCGSAWLRLRGSNGESCYSGNGSLVVNLPGVYYEQIIGTHSVCVYAQADRQIFCAVGPGSFSISPPITIREINIRTPLLAHYTSRLLHHRVGTGLQYRYRASDEFFVFPPSRPELLYLRIEPSLAA
jgi:hypothetical protein